MKLQTYINGEWKDSSNKTLRDITNPANGEVIPRGCRRNVGRSRGSKLTPALPVSTPIFRHLLRCEVAISSGIGIGRSLGTYGLEDFQEIKQININMNVGPVG